MPKQPIRICEGSARPHEAFWRVRDAAESESGEPEMEFYGMISEYSWFEDDITPQVFKADLMRIGGGGPVTVRMNSGGGDVFAASVIRSTLVEYPARVTVRIDGLAASAATIVATAGDVVKMQDSAYFMIHNPWMITWGDEGELKHALEFLKTIKSGIVDTYEVRTEMSREKIAKMMADETWMTAQEAKDLGFIDEVITTKAKTPANMAVLNALRPAGLSQFRNMPAALQSLMADQGNAEPADSSPDEPVDTTAVEPPEAARLRAEVKLYLK